MTWLAPEFETPEDRALRRLSVVTQPAGVVVPPDVWRGAAMETGLSVARIKLLAREAVAGDDPRVAWYAAHLERLHRRTPRGPIDSSRVRLADWLRRRGLTWRQVARACGYAEADNGRSIRRAVRRYRQRLANGDTLPKARAAYQRRQRGKGWTAIARRVGYASARSARVMARRYAERAGLPWPVPVQVVPTANWVRATLQHGRLWPAG